MKSMWFIRAFRGNLLLAPLSLIGCNPTLLSVGPSMKKRSSSLTRAGGGKTQTPSKLDKGTTDDQGG